MQDGVDPREPHDVLARPTVTGVNLPAGVRATGDHAELRLEGRIGASTLSEARLALNDAIDRGTGDLVVHLCDVAIADRTGLGLIVAAHHRARRRGRRLILAGVSPALRRFLGRTQRDLVLR